MVGQRLHLLELPPELIKECLGYVNIREILLNIAPLCSMLNRIVVETIGENVMHDGDRSGEITSPQSPGIIAEVSEQYKILRRLKEAYDKMYEQSMQIFHDKRIIRANAAARTLCGQFCPPSDFEWLLTPDDPQVLEFFTARGMDLESQCRFSEFCDLHNYIRKEYCVREKFLLEHFHPKEESKRSRWKGALTKRGKEACKRIFNYFDEDRDNKLSWDELSAINMAAELPLSQSAFVWVQQTYDTDLEGNLTRQGYEDMFLENFIRVPRLMYLDLIKLEKFMNRTGKRARQNCTHEIRQSEFRSNQPESGLPNTSAIRSLRSESTSSSVTSTYFQIEDSEDDGVEEIEQPPTVRRRVESISTMFSESVIIPNE